jgi:hypothetical protein
MSIRRQAGILAGKIIVASAVAACLSACGGDERDAKKVVLEMMKDPESVKFGEFTKFDSDLACLTANAKNSFGGYNGDKQFLLLKLNRGWFPIGPIENTHKGCIDSAKDEDIKASLERMRNLQ